MRLDVSRLETPLGTVTLISTEVGLAGLAFDNRVESLWHFLKGRFRSVEADDSRSMDPAAGDIRAYFDGDVEALERVRTDAGGTEFQRRVWTALRLIPGGRTASYRDVARSIGQPTGFRAVATANATNPVAIVIPCHRVIHADGSISGYGGGVDRKKWLLRHEAESLPFALGATINATPETLRQEP